MRVFPFPVDWSSPFKITYSAATEIITSRSNREQRRAGRLTPRKAFEFAVSVTFAHRRVYEGLLTAWMNRQMVVAEAPRCIILAADASAGPTIDVPEVTSWMQAGAYIVLNNGDDWAFAQIDSVDDPTLTLVDDLADAWPAGTKVYAGVVGRMTAGPAQEETNEVWTLSIEFAAEPGVQPAETAGAALETFNGREVLALPLNWGSTPNSDFVFPSETVDFGRGVASSFYPVAFMSRTRSVTTLAQSKDDAEKIRQFFWRMLGQLEEFYAPTGSNDLPVADHASGSLTVIGTQVFEDYATDTVHKALCVYLKDGTRLYRSVTGITSVGGNSVLAITPTWTFSNANVRKISWMPVWRLASDELNIEWLTDTVAQAQMAFVSLEDLTGN